MSTILGRLAGRARQSAFRTSFRNASGEAEVEARAVTSDLKAKKQETKSILQKGAKRDPELYILLTIMTGAFGLAGWYFGRKPTSASSETAVSMAPGSMPWQTESKGDGADEHFKYQYHPEGDKTKKPKNAPSALNSVIVPNVTLPKAAHDRFNKYGKEGY